MTGSDLSRIIVLNEDITSIKVDAIVNAANQSLMGGGGVDGAIHRKGGPEILEECKMIVARQGGCPAGGAVITCAGKLPARYVIHTAGPVWNGGGSEEEFILKKCYLSSLHLASEHACKTISFPNISTGIYHFPKESAAGIAIETVKGFMETYEYPSKVIFACFDSDNYGMYMDLLNITQ